MMRPPPPCAIICLAARCAHKNGPVKLTASVLSHSSFGTSTNGNLLLDAGIVDKDVEALEAFDRLIDEHRDLLGIAHVGGDGHRLAADRLDAPRPALWPARCCRRNRSRPSRRRARSASRSPARCRSPRPSRSLLYVLRFIVHSLCRKGTVSREPSRALRALYAACRAAARGSTRATETMPGSRSQVMRYRADRRGLRAARSRPSCRASCTRTASSLRPRTRRQEDCVPSSGRLAHGVLRGLGIETAAGLRDLRAIAQRPHARFASVPTRSGFTTIAPCFECSTSSSVDEARGRDAGAPHDRL